MLIFIFISIFVFTVYMYIGWRIIPVLMVGSFTKIMLWIAMLSLAFLIPVFFYIRVNYQTRPWHDGLAWITYLSFGFFSLLTTILVIKDLGLITIHLLENPLLSNKNILPVAPHRRAFLLNSLNYLSLGTAAAASLYGYIQARMRLVIERVDVKVADLHPDLEGFTIAQVSDIHIGPTIKNDFLKKIVSKVNDLDADMVAVTGDVVDGSVKSLWNDILPIASLKSRYGSFFVTGNHEYYSGALSWSKAFTRLGLQVLNNEHKIIRHKKVRLLVGGVTDYSAGHTIPGHLSDPFKAIKGAPKNDYKLLLAHQPRSVYKAAQAGFDLQLSGHTHAGQYFPGNILVYLFQPFIKGLNIYEKTQVYVNRGTGYWGPPIRIGSDAEITLLTLTKGSP